MTEPKLCAHCRVYGHLRFRPTEALTRALLMLWVGRARKAGDLLHRKKIEAELEDKAGDENAGSTVSVAARHRRSITGWEGRQSVI